MLRQVLSPVCNMSFVLPFLFALIFWCSCLQIGDELKCIEENTVSNVLTKTLGKCPLFFHLHPASLTPDPTVYRKIIHDKGEIVLSFDHLVYVPPSPGTQKGDTFDSLPPFSSDSDNFREPQGLVAGELIVVDDGGTLTAVEILEVKDHSDDTFYAPICKGGMCVVDGVVTSSYVTIDGFDAFDTEDAAHYIWNAIFTGRMWPLMTTGVLDYYTTNAGLTRDDPTYQVWEETNYAGYALSHYVLTLQAMYLNQINNETLTAEEAIAFHNKMMELSSGGTTPVDDAVMASLYGDAITGNL